MKPDQEAKSRSQERFGQFAERYVTSQSHAKGSDLDRLFEIANPQADWLVLDVATGGGHTALKFAPHVQSVIASDLTFKMLAASSKMKRTSACLPWNSAKRFPFLRGFCVLIL